MTGESVEFQSKPAQIGPSILTSDLLHLGDQIELVERSGADYLHIDIMDGMFVPNITFGPVMVRTVKRVSTLPIDVHLMVHAPERYIDEFADAGSDTLTVHVEATVHLHSTLQRIKRHGLRAGVALAPATPLVMLEEVLPMTDMVDQVLIMSVNPGFGGQSFIPTSLDKIARTHAMIHRVNPACTLQVDGGIKASNIGRVRVAGADMFVVGSGVFNDETSVPAAVAALREALDRADAPAYGHEEA